MKVTTSAHSLRAAVTWAARQAPARPANPIVAAAVLSTVGGSTVRVECFDFTTAATASLPATVHTGGRTAVSARLLAEVVKALPDGTVDVVADGGRLTVTVDTFRYVLPVMPVEDYPTLPAAPDLTHETPAAVLANTLAALAGMTHGPDIPGIHCVRVQPGEHALILAATDRFRIAEVTLPWSSSPGQAGEPVLLSAESAHAVADLAKAASVGQDVSLAFPAAGAGVFAAATTDRQIVTALVDGDFPKYRSLFGGEPVRTLTVDRAALAGLAKRVSLVLGPAEPMRFTAAGGQLTASGVSGSDHGESRGSVPADLSPEWDEAPWTWGLNPWFLTSLLDLLPAARVRFDMTSPAKVLRIIPAPGDDSVPYVATTALMPVRLPALGGAS